MYFFLVKKRVDPWNCYIWRPWTEVKSAGTVSGNGN